MDIQRLLKGTLSGQIVQQLDAADGKKDGKISASIWNEFVKDKGGKEIKYSISIERALKSVATYSVRESKKSQGSKNVNQVAKEWLSDIKNLQQVSKESDIPPKKIETVPDDPNPPVEKIDPPAALSKEKMDELNVKHEENAGKTVTNADGTKTKYDKNGYITGIYDKNDNRLFGVARNDDGSVMRYEGTYVKAEYDENNNVIKEWEWNSKGEHTKMGEFEYDSDVIERETKFILRDSRGCIKYYQTHVYENGSKTTIYHDSKGKITKYQITKDKDNKFFLSSWDMIIEYDREGNLVNYGTPDGISKDANGRVIKEDK